MICVDTDQTARESNCSGRQPASNVMCVGEKSRVVVWRIRRSLCSDVPLCALLSLRHAYTPSWIYLVIQSWMVVILRPTRVDIFRSDKPSMKIRQCDHVPWTFIQIISQLFIVSDVFSGLHRKSQMLRKTSDFVYVKEKLLTFIEWISIPLDQMQSEIESFAYLSHNYRFWYLYDATCIISWCNL